jgi:hypothetical protein
MNRGPTILFLGQGYLRLGADRDPFLDEALRKFGKAQDSSADYFSLLDSSAAANIQAALAWMDERCRRLSAPDWLKIVAGHEWSSLYLSAIDSIWQASFRLSWRELHPLFEEKYRPADPRNRAVLHCTYLFGSVNRAEETERPPLTRFDFMKRKQIAVALARRLPELVTPLGTLIIEGYAGQGDWFAPEELAPILDELSPGQIHLFSATDELQRNQYFRELVRRGKILFHSESLASAISEGSELGLLRKRPFLGEEIGRSITVGENVLSVPLDLWNQVSRSAIILEDSSLVAPPSLSEDARYHEFRNFLAISDGKPQWSGYARGFAFWRRFMKPFKDAIENRLASRTLQDDPIILHGQTGTGKTIALGALAFAVRSARKYPVLFIERSTRRPSPAETDRFCQWAEDGGADATLILWDGMTEEEEYADFLRYLTGRGRKVVLVGTCYRLPEQRTSSARYVLAPPKLDQEETAEFAAFLRSFHPALDQIMLGSTEHVDDTFLVALYRLLPSTRSQIRAGVAQEVGHAERVIAKKATELPPVLVGGTVLAQALFAAGLITVEQLAAAVTGRIGGELVSDIEDITGLVMVPGRFGLRVPLELLLRALGKRGLAGIGRLLEGIDVFRWFEDSVGNIEIGPRHPLEARLLVQSRMGGAKTETAFASRLVVEVRDGGDSLEMNETRFAVDLVRSIGPQGLDSAYFAPHFRDIAGTLSELRVERGVENPRLMLQEVNLLREWAVDRAQLGAPSAEIRTAFDEAERVVRRALEMVGSEKRHRPIRNALLVELAALLGSKARAVIDYEKQKEAAVPLFAQVRKAVFEARAQDPTTYYPIDVLAWTTRDVLSAGVLDEQSRAEALADLTYAFQTTDPEDFDSSQRERFFSRQLEMAEILNSADMGDRAFAALERMGSGAGYFLRAVQIAGLRRASRATTPSDPERLKTAYHYLEQNRARVSSDTRCVDLLLDLWWMLNSRAKILERERATVPFSDEQWRSCLGLVREVEATGNSVRPITLAFLRGLALFHLKEVEESIGVFREVERESDRVRGRRRIIRSYLASTAAGEPMKFHGTVAWVTDNQRRGGVYAEELRRVIHFLPIDFGRPDIARGDNLGEFHVAFNFLGPVADPPGFYRQHS